VIGGMMDGVKILGFGTLSKKLKVNAHKFSATAKAAIEAAGGEAVTL
jgi:large subunit ribosomal protein L15